MELVGAEELITVFFNILAFLKKSYRLRLVDSYSCLNSLILNNDLTVTVIVSTSVHVVLIAHSEKKID